MAGIAAIFLSIGVALLGLIAVRRRVPLHALKAQHEVASVSFAVIGGFYAVLLAFVLVASWERFERARENTDHEANALADLYRQAGGLPEPTRSAIRTEIVTYVHSVIDTEWHTMQDNSLSPHTQQLYFDVWTSILEMTPEDAKQTALFQCMVEKLDDFGEARRYRLLYMENGLPPVIWGFL